MDAFVTMRHYISDNLIEQKFINRQVLKNTEDMIISEELSLNKQNQVVKSLKPIK